MLSALVVGCKVRDDLERKIKRYLFELINSPVVDILAALALALEKCNEVGCVVACVDDESAQVVLLLLSLVFLEDTETIHY